jgi:hypothetical protein
MKAGWFTLKPSKLQRSERMKRLLSAVLVAFLASPVGALAGTDHDHAAKHGGVVVETSGHHNLELVTSDGVLEIYVTEHDDGAAEDVKGTKATATVLSEGKKEEISLVPQSGNLLKGTGSFKSGKGTVIVITLSMPDHKPEQARFKLD